MSQAPDDLPLLDDDLDPDPIRQVERWVADATAAGILEPTAMTLATIDDAGRPQARTVLLRGIDERGFRFYTNLGSRKARAIDGRPFAAIVLLWKELGRQVKAEGRVEHLTREESAAYFATRPRGHRLSAWASRQSEPVGSREEMEATFRATEERFANVEDVPLPDHWGGFLLRPDVVEVWNGRSNRMHDRFRYTRGADGWTRSRVWP